MNSLQIPIQWDKLNTLTSFLDAGLSAKGVSTPLRMQYIALAEEFFNEILHASNDKTGVLRCAVGPDRTILESSLPGLQPQRLETLCRTSCGSLTVSAGESRCVVTEK